MLDSERVITLKLAWHLYSWALRVWGDLWGDLAPGCRLIAVASKLTGFGGASNHSRLILAATPVAIEQNLHIESVVLGGA